MEVATPEQQRALTFVVACARSGYSPTFAEITGWLESPLPKGARYAAPNGFLSAIDFMNSLGFGVERQLLTQAESTTQHLVRIGWLMEKSGRVAISRLGEAIHSASELSESAQDEAGIVLLGKDDPLAYPKLFGHLDKTGAGLLVDPYIRLKELHDLVYHTKLTRVLTRPNATDSTAIEVYLSNAVFPRNVEVRACSDKTMHDRWLISENGDVQTLGASVNGVNQVTTVLTPVPTVAARKLVEVAEEWWAAGTPLSSLAGTPPDSAPGTGQSGVSVNSAGVSSTVSTS